MKLPAAMHLNIPSSSGSNATRGSLWILGTLLVLAAVVAGSGAYVTASTERFLAENPVDPAEERRLGLELDRLNQRLERVTSSLVELAPIEAEARMLAALGPAPAMYTDPLVQSGITELHDRTLARSFRDVTRRLNLARHRAGTLTRSYDQILATMETHAELWMRIPSTRPLEQARVSSDYGVRRDPFTGRLAWHRGLDLSAPFGTPIRASAEGYVLRAGWHGAYGRLVEMDHGNGIVTRYAHASRLAVHPGDRVRRGQIVAYVGASGRANAPHLHYEVRLHGEPVNPEPYP